MLKTKAVALTGSPLVFSTNRYINDTLHNHAYASALAHSVLYLKLVLTGRRCPPNLQTAPKHRTLRISRHIAYATPYGTALAILTPMCPERRTSNCDLGLWGWLQEAPNPCCSTSYNYIDCKLVCRRTGRHSTLLRLNRPPYSPDRIFKKSLCSGRNLLGYLCVVLETRGGLISY